MSEDERESGPTVETSAAAAPSSGPTPGAVLLGIFFLVFGICFLLAGGGCTLFLLWMLAMSPREFGMFGGLLAIALPTAVGGYFAIRFAIRLLSGTPAAAPSPGAPENQPPMNGR